MTWEGVYVLAGFALAAFYVPQIQVLLRDRTGVAAYSMRKGCCQLAARALMLPFVFITVDSQTMLLMQSLDIVLRAVEVGAALWSGTVQRRTQPALPAHVDGNTN